MLLQLWQMMHGAHSKVELTGNQLRASLLLARTFLQNADAWEVWGSNKSAPATDIERGPRVGPSS